MVSVLTITGILSSCLYSYKVILASRKTDTEVKAEYETEKKEIVSSDSKEKILPDKHSELLALQNQINPHFLYNTLDSIRGQALIDGVDEIADMTEALSAFFRYSISRRGNLVRLCEEIKNVDNYMKIQQFRFEDKYILEKHLDCSEEELNIYVPKMILQPLVENAIFHGLEEIEEQGRIILRIVSTENKLRIIVEDDGTGMPDSRVRKLNRQFRNPENGGESSSAQNSGIALKNVNERIQLYFGMEYGLYIRSVAGIGTQVEILIPQKADLQVLEGKS